MLAETDELIGPVGVVSSVMDTNSGVGTRTLVVRGEEESSALEEGSILCLTDRRVLGSVAEVFGPVR